MSFIDYSDRMWGVDSLLRVRILRQLLKALINWLVLFYIFVKTGCQSYYLNNKPKKSSEVIKLQNQLLWRNKVFVEGTMWGC